jgi:PAS domain S-box-containing protein
VALHAVADELERQLAGKGIDAPAMEAFLARQGQRLPEVVAFRVANADGRVILNKGDKSKLVSWAGRDYFRYHRDHAEDSLIVSKPFIGAVTAKQVIGLTRRYNHPDGSFAGVVIAPILLDHLTRLMSQFDLGPKSTIVLRDADLGLIARFPPLPDQPVGQVGHNAVSSELRQLVESGVSAATFTTPTSTDGMQRLGALRRLGNAPIIALVGLAGDEYLKDWNRELYVTAGTALGFLVFSLVLGGFLLRSLRQAEFREEERLRTNIALQESEREMNEAQRIAKAGSYITDVQAGVWTSSPTLDDIFGIDAAFVRTIENWGKLVAPEYADKLLAYYHRVVLTRARFDTEYPIIRPADGQLRWVWAQGEFTFADDGTPLILKGAIQDITAYKATELELQGYRENLEALVGEKTEYLQQAMEDLRVSEEKHRILLDESSDPIFNFTPDGRYRYVNLAFAEALGKTQEEIIGKSVWDIFPGAEADKRFAVISEVFKNGDIRAIEVCVPHPAGERHLITTVKPIFNDQQRVISVVCISRDITDIKNAQLAQQNALVIAEQLARIKSDFLANMSHEIRTPLNGVLGMAQIGHRESVGRGRSQEMFARILESGKLLLSIINDILDFSKIEAGKLAVEARPMRLAGVINDAAALIAERAAAKGLELSIRPSPDLPAWVSGDAMRVQQILINLLSNAIKFTERGRVSLMAQRDENNIWFAVSDEGIGMTPDEVSRLFRPFEQADNSTCRKFGGTGLGLSISNNLASLMGGSIRVISAPGSGSTFTLMLPLPATTAPPEAESISSDTVPGNASQRLAGIQILAAEDNEVNQLVLEDLLVQEGVNLILVGNGRLALEQVEKGASQFDLVLMDMQMPEMDGLEATRRIRAIAPNLPIIGQTAHALAEEHAKCRAAGMNDVITKPLDADKLVAVVLQHLGRTPEALPVAPAEKVGASGTATEVAATEESATEGSASVLDWSQLEARYGSRPEYLAKLLNIALESQSGTSAEIRTVVTTATTLPRLAELAHTLKGTAGFLFAHDLMEKARTAEKAARAGSPDVAGHAEALACALEALLEEIRSRRRT